MTPSRWRCFSRRRPVNSSEVKICEPSDSNAAVPARFTITSISAPELAPAPDLYRAAKAGDLQAIAGLLLQPGCNIDQRCEGETALLVAAAEGHAGAVALLLDAGADATLANECADSTTCAGWFAILSAAQSENSAETVALLLARRPDDLHARTHLGNTAIHVAAFNGRLSATKLLVARGADVHAHAQDGYTPLDNARHRLVDCPCKTAERLAEWGAVIAFLERVEPMDADERRIFAQRSWELTVASALQEAAEAGRVAELGRRLACYERDVDARDHDGTTALHSAALGGHTEAVCLLLGAGAGVDVRSNLEETPLHMAAREGLLDVAGVLLERGADATARTKFGASAADLARRHQRREWHALASRLDEVARG